MIPNFSRLRFLISLYLTLLILLLLCVLATPMSIRHSISMTPNFIIDEDILETALIAVLFGISSVILIAFKNRLKEYQEAVNQVREEKSNLISRLSEAFSYIGSVNLEIQELQSIFCSIDQFPKSKNEFKQLINHLTAKATAIASAPWGVIRIIDKSNGRTVKEHAVEFRKKALPSTTVGNRAIVEEDSTEAFRLIRSSQKNTDLLTVCILPQGPLSKQNSALITAIVNQVEMYFLLYQTGVLRQKSSIRYHSEEDFEDNKQLHKPSYYE